MNETSSLVEALASPAPSAPTEMVGVSEQLFNQSMGSMENLFVVQLVGTGIIAGCLIASVVLRFFHVH
ncbi:MAG: hypothetical protein RR394_09650 [Oscillospiraceae bacterium]